ncbi:hypothetical protein IV203_014115 [Nitzschia inconspicua]|uniref:Uncharacterized protein n=1 Tax=Nitzschia inconspicua TaxID=303405 RepID=A0A9K3K5H3_9STRA|nr:hypothetical protein IV203_014302 [Nitzschia inconspicua]KAG7375020.1 hypothetical protein IV203_014115 [Nitzschia inconspicua]
MFLVSLKLVLSLFVIMADVVGGMTDGVGGAHPGPTVDVGSSSHRLASSRFLDETANQNNNNVDETTNSYEDYQQWKESNMTDEERKQQEEEEKRQQQYEQEQEEYEQQLQQKEMEKFQEYLEWKWNMTETSQLGENNLYYYNSDGNGLSFVNNSPNLSAGRQWAIGSLMLLTGLVVGVGAAMFITRRNMMTSSKRTPLMDDPKTDIA